MRPLGVLAVALFGFAAPAAASGPALTVPKSDMRAALTCVGKVANAKQTPIMLVTGTGATGGQAYALAKGELDHFGHPVCYIDFPDFMTGDIQISVQYLVYGLRREFRLAGRKVAVLGISQGGMLPRFALTYWPDLRSKVSDVVASAGTQHGTTVDFCTAEGMCTPAGWQQLRGSKLLRALNSQPDETPGRVSYTTVRSLTDETVKPQGGKHPTSALEGARNILIQAICPGRRTTHIGTGIDSVNYAAATDAIRRRGAGKRGAAKVSDFPSGVCSHPYGPGLDEATTDALLAGSGGTILNQIMASPTVSAEPKVRKVFRRRP